VTRRPQTAARFAEIGGLALVSLLAFDSTGLKRSVETHPRAERVGTVISPGLVLTHMLPGEISVLPRPLVAYGLLSSVADAVACLSLADGVVVLPTLAADLARTVATAAELRRIPLTTASAVG
jgi:hypothetical protein